MIILSDNKKTLPRQRFFVCDVIGYRCKLPLK